MLTGSQIRRKFLDYFVQHGHKEVHSSSLVPANDPTLLFTNAGMNQFKDVFLGLETRDYKCATTSQKCVRAGGKHNDLENVGFTNRHHTFFEMLGNFSFGDYSKEKAIPYAWELITSPQWFGIAKDKLYVTIFDDPDKAAASRELGFDVVRDHDAEKYWLEVGVPKERIFPGGRKDNFWQMGDTGPCGPCSEIHYDMGPAASDQGHTDCAFGCDCGRYVEIWNLVFMQYDRDASGTKQLPKPSIDTGMGLERLAAVLQGVISNYDTDLFTPLIRRAAELTGTTSEHVEPGLRPGGAGQRPASTQPAEQSSAEGAAHKSAASLRVIADHSRAATFLISDGVLPSNEGRGYVLRKIIRRAITHGRLLGQEKPFFHLMVPEVVQMMAMPVQTAPYRELLASADRVEKVVCQEETRFAHTLDIGLKRLEIDLREIFDRWDKIGELARNTKGVEEVKLNPLYEGEKAFKLYDTFGMPLDFMQDAARDQGINFDQEGFDRAMAEQRERARASWKGGAKHSANPVYREVKPTEFLGYNYFELMGCFVLAIVRNGSSVPELLNDQEGEVILDRTPFYADAGGQVGDVGWLLSEFEDFVLAEVHGCYRPAPGVRAHRVNAKSRIVVHDRIRAKVNMDVRESTMRNHTATHLLQAGLREVLGKHVKQAGSLVAPDHLRFDFSHFTSVADEELQDIEDLINKEVLRNEKVEVIENVPIDVAINEYKAMALFGEKYGDRVRVIKIGDFSTELCGGTHTDATGEIGLIKVLKEGSVSSGVRRIEAVTGEGSVQHFREAYATEQEARRWVVTDRKGLSPKIEEVDGSINQFTLESHWRLPAALHEEFRTKDSEIKRLQRELEQVRMKSASSTVASVTDKIKDVHGVKVLAHRVDNLERAQMRTLVDQLRDKLGSGVVVLGSANNGNVALIVGVTKDLTSRIQAGKVIGPVAEKVGGKGGGRPDLAEAGGKSPEALDAALGEAYGVVEQLLGSS
jgi:alanyl-tRNA synthetase